MGDFRPYSPIDESFGGLVVALDDRFEFEGGEAALVDDAAALHEGVVDGGRLAEDDRGDRVVMGTPFVRST